MDEQNVQETTWQWRWSRYTGNMYGPIPVGLIVLGLGFIVFVTYLVIKIANTDPSMKDNDGRPAGLLPLADAGAFPANHRATVPAVADAVTRSGEQPEEFFAEVEAGRADGMVVFHLWHRSAW